MADGSITGHRYAGLPQNTADDRVRARELFKYWQPPSVAAESIDTVLTAHAQLVAWRLHAERSMISLIDEETQYFVAESTKTVHLDDAEKYDDPDDAIWAGCARSPKAGRLCEHTISTPLPPEGGPACFEILDLSKDERFNQLGFITGPPHFRYYAGVPLRTCKGINIGSIYILDSKLRPALTRTEKKFLGVMADNVIQHLEMSRDKKDRQRTFRMNECLSAYVDPPPEETRRRRRYSDRSQSTGTDSDAGSQRTADSSRRLEVISRAAELLRESIDIEEGGGGVLYLDTSLATVPSQQPFQGAGRPSRTLDLGSRTHQETLHPQPQNIEAQSGVEKTNTRSMIPETSQNQTSDTDVLVHTYKSTGQSLSQLEFIPFKPDELLKIIKRHPRGKMFTYDGQGNDLSDSSDNETVFNGRPRSSKRHQRSLADSTLLRTHFPKARQIMFAPIWDSTTSRSSICFAYNCSEFRNFTHQLEFLHFITFNNCVDTELLRLSNLKAADQKNDFIGSISHELRSPLHGILASCEFLQDTTCTSFQQSLVQTAESCARTLLDTVNMVLDYSKINAFERNKLGGAKLSTTDGVQTKQREAFQSNLNAHSYIDLAALTEEVVEGVATGHGFHDSESLTMPWSSINRSKSSNTSVPPRRPDVKVVVEVADQDWTYWCEPGSIRRIVMNLVGNSLKYTPAGFVHVKLNTQTAEPDSVEFGVLTVTDSGQGMTPAYLKNKLFKPFAQESNQAPGIGLGLSLIKSIVDKMGGQIDVASTVGVGTDVTVRFPLTRKPSLELIDTGAITPGFSETRSSFFDNSSTLKQLAPRTGGTSIAIYWPEAEGTTKSQQQASRLLFETLVSYLGAWSSTPVHSWQANLTADILVVEEAAIDDLLQRYPQLSAPHCSTTLLVIRGIGSAGFEVSKNIENVRHPIGPRKLAKALQACTDRLKVKPESTIENGAPIESITSATAYLSISFDYKTEADATTRHGPSSPNEDKVDNTEDLTAFKAPLEALETLRSLPASAALNLSSPKHHILLVDDNAINLRLLQVGMRKRGYTSISSATDGLQAVNTYRTLLHSSPPAPPDIILMDLSMPVMNGFDATRLIREIETEYNNALAPEQARRHSLIIALTGLASVRDQKEAYMAGVDSYVMKPVSFAKLGKLLEEWADNGKAVAVDFVPDSV